MWSTECAIYSMESVFALQLRTSCFNKIWCFINRKISLLLFYYFDLIAGDRNLRYSVMRQRTNKRNIGTVKYVAVVIECVQIDSELPHFFASSNAKRFEIKELRLLYISFQQSIQLHRKVRLSLIRIIIWTW